MDASKNVLHAVNKDNSSVKFLSEIKEKAKHRYKEAIKDFGESVGLTYTKVGSSNNVAEDGHTQR